MNTKEKILEMVDSVMNKKFSNHMCMHCGGSSVIYVGDGVRMDVLDINSKAWVEGIMITLSCSNCGALSYFLPKFFFGDKEQEFRELISKTLEAKQEENKSEEKASSNKGE